MDHRVRKRIKEAKSKARPGLFLSLIRACCSRFAHGKETCNYARSTRKHNQTQLAEYFTFTHSFVQFASFHELDWVLFVSEKNRKYTKTSKNRVYLPELREREREPCEREPIF